MPTFFVASIIICIVLALCVVTFFIVLKRMADRGRQTPVTCDLECKDSKTLIVLVHGTRNTAIYLDNIRSILADLHKNADLLPVQYASDVPSNADPFLVSEQICQKIHEAHTQAQYDDIIMVGYSKGALLVRKALVYGYGRVEDLDTEPGVSRPALPWVRQVRRFVLLAGMNRGWSLRFRPKQMPRRVFLLLRFLSRFGRIIGVAKLMNNCESGEPFVANLRLQWLDVMRSLQVQDRPTVIQLLGDKDDLVSSEDQRDVTVARDFIWVRVNCTGHPDIVELNDPILGPERRDKIKKALGNAADIESLRLLSSKIANDEDPDVQEVVVVLHGIRDMGAWTSQFEAPLQQAYHLKHANDGSKIYVTRPSYGYFGMGPFLLWADRQKNVRWFMDEFTEIKARFPNLQKVHFIGHSNGTYVLASALQNYKTLKVGNIAFGGCVLRRNFDWDSVASQFDAVRNYVGSRDWVVAIFPALFERPFFRLINHDIGSAGFDGFTTTRGNELETRFLNGDHGIALDAANIGSIVEFIVNGVRVDNPDLWSAGPPPRLERESKFCWMIWIALVVAAVVVLCLWTYGIVTLFAHFAPGISPMLVAALAAIAYILLIVMVLETY